MAKALDQELFQYILRLNEAEKQSVLQMLKTFLKGREANIARTSIGQYNKQIDEAIARVEAGEYYTQEEAEHMAKEWQPMRKILWDKQALHYFRDTIQYIRKDSPQNAGK